MQVAWASVLATVFEEPLFRSMAYVVAGLVAVVYLGCSLLVLVQQRFEAEPRMLEFDPDDYDWPEEINELFTTAVADLSELGFEVVRGVFLPSAVPNVQTALILLVNRAEKDSVIVTAMYATSPGANIKNLYVEFCTRFEDGFEYNTNNSTQLSSFPASGATTTHQLVEVANSRSLYAVHQAIMARDGRNPSQKVLRLDREFGGDAVAFLQHGMRDEFESAAARGYVRLTSDGETYRPTVKGALLMVWKELWPWKSIRKLQRDRRASALSEVALQY